MPNDVYCAFTGAIPDDADLPTDHPLEDEELSDLPVGWTLPPSDLEDAKNLLSTLTPMIDPASDFELEPGRFAPASESKGALLTKMINGISLFGCWHFPVPALP